MNSTVKDLLLIIIVALCLGMYIARDLKIDQDKRLLDLENDVRYFRSCLECVEETCDSRFECSMDYWISIKHKWYNE